MKNYKEKRVKELVFCLLVIAIPTIQFAFFYIGVNINSIIMAFQKYDMSNDVGKYVYNGFNNFKKIYIDLTNGKEVLFSLKNSLLLFSVNILVGTTLSLLFSLYIYKKRFMSKIFRALLFAPSILSAIVTVTMFKQFVEVAIPSLLPSLNGVGLLSNGSTKMATLIFFTIWIGFGTQILMYSGAMNTIDQSIIEASSLDGVNSLQEFIYIIFPLIYPTFLTFLTANIAGMFTNQLNLFSFYGNGAGMQYSTIGYYLFKNTNIASMGELPVLAAYSVILTFIAAPLTLFTRKLLEKIGPKMI